MPQVGTGAMKPEVPPSRRGVGYLKIPEGAFAVAGLRVCTRVGFCAQPQLLCGYDLTKQLSGAEWYATQPRSEQIPRSNAADAEGSFLLERKFRLSVTTNLWRSVRVRGKLRKSLTSRSGQGPCFCGDLSAVRLAWVAT
eukprot:s444_g26.t1